MNLLHERYTTFVLVKCLWNITFWIEVCAEIGKYGLIQNNRLTCRFKWSIGSMAMLKLTFPASVLVWRAFSSVQGWVSLENLFYQWRSELSQDHFYIQRSAEAWGLTAGWWDFTGCSNCPLLWHTHCMAAAHAGAYRLCFSAQHHMLLRSVCARIRGVAAALPAVPQLRAPGATGKGMNALTFRDDL